MVKKFIVAVLFFTAMGLYAQNGTVSPYSYFGIGESRTGTTVEHQMMGALGVYGDSIHLNLTNPAALSRLGVKVGEDYGITIYTVGVSHNRIRLKSFTEEESTTVTNLDYLSLGFSLGKGFGVGFGIAPFSSVGYDVISESTNENGALVTNVAAGEGGVNRAYFSLGYEFLKNLSIGVTANLNFGTLEYRNVQSVEDVQFGTRDLKNSKVNGMDFNYALYYTPAINEKYTLFASARVNTQANLTSKNTQELSSFLVSSEQIIETIDVDLDALGLRNTYLKIPTTSTFGIGIGQNMKWFLGAEYSFQSMGSFSNDFLGSDNVVYQNAGTYAFGGSFVPDATSFNNYLKRVNYRAGVRYNKTGMLVNDTEINNLGITFGLGLPLGRSFSNLNVGFEFGKRGTTTADLIEENYFKINIGMSFNDLWFQKRKIN